MKPTGRSSILGKNDEDRVRHFLSAHPDFFARNPSLVERLIVPHACGPAQSLIEHQVALLRVRNRKLERRLQELMANARDNESLHARVHALGLRLLGCTDADVLFDVAYHTLCKDFRADAVSVRVRVSADKAQALGRIEFVSKPEAAGTEADRTQADGVQMLFNLASSQCGILSEGARVGLFGWPAASAGSGVLVPLQVLGQPGLLGLASRDAQRFHAHMGTTFLDQLAGMLSLSLARLLEGDA